MKKALLVIFGIILFIALWSAMSDNKNDNAVSAKTETTKSEEKIVYTASTRKAYETTLHNSFLDNNLDIKVAVKGKNKDVLELKYALFNDVWLRKLETGGNLNQWHEMGFKKIVVTDGYDYNQEVNWKN